MLRIILGGQLRRLREAQGISVPEAGYAIRSSPSKITRMERGGSRFKQIDLADLLTLYGVNDQHERDALSYLARQADSRHWWHSYSDLLPAWFETYLGLEEAAAGIRTYELQFVPGLLHTPSYARAVALVGNADAPPGEIERRVSLRMARQSLLTRPPPTQLWAVVDEAALRRGVGGAEVMRGQLRHLIEATELPNVTLQVLPFRAGGHAAAAGAFTILRFAEMDLPDVVYLEQLTSAVYLDKHDDVKHYRSVMDRLCVQAEPAPLVRQILGEILKDL